MKSCDVLIAGGGPAGSACAWALRGSGVKVAVLDKQRFPRDKVCGGWITPRVLTLLEIDPSAYGAGRVLQPISGFRTGCIGTTSLQATDYGDTVSYGIRRCEFDNYLLKRCEATLCEGVSLSKLERTGDGWLVNGEITARLVVGAGGHFCPVARHFRDGRVESPVVAQETEFEMDARQALACPVQGAVPELYFCSDFKGYGWCFRKGNFLNIGLGRADPHELPDHVRRFRRFLTEDRAIPEMPAWRGHAYLLGGTSPRPIAGDGYLLIGDAAGLAFAHSGEGILPAIESGLLAARAILAARGNYSRKELAPYVRKMEQSHSAADGMWMQLGSFLPRGLLRTAADRLMTKPWFVRHVVLDRWFLRR
jgi:flavin-dependent dehydrogenase